MAAMVSVAVAEIFGTCEANEVAVSLNPPVERAALADLGAAIAWAREWRDVPGTQWTTRQWPSAGAQQVPVRLVLHGAEAIAAFAGRQPARDWRVLNERAAQVRERLGGRTANTPALGTDQLAGAIRTHGHTLLGLDDQDFGRLLDVVLWFVAHPASGNYRSEASTRSGWPVIERS